MDTASPSAELTPLDAQARLAELRHELLQRPLTDAELQESVRLIAFQRQTNTGTGKKAAAASPAPKGNPLDFF